MSLMDELITSGQIATYKKGEHVFQCGDFDTDFYIVKNGLTKAYYITPDGKEFIKSFIAEENVIACMQAVIENKEANFSLVALEESQIFCVPKTTFMMLLKTGDHLSEVNRVLVNLALKKEQREYDFLCLSATERYIKFRTATPELELRLTQVDIARYLGITPVALSRIRNQLK